MKKKGLAIIICLIMAMCCLMASTIIVFADNATVTITFKPEADEFLEDSVEIEKGTAVEFPAGITRPGYKVIWKNNGVDYDFTTPVNQNITLNATWAPAYTDEQGNDIVFDKNGVTTAKIYYEGKVVQPNVSNYLYQDDEVVAHNGIYDPYTQYFIKEEGSIFTLGERAYVKEAADKPLLAEKVFFPRYIQLGEGFDVNKDILVKFKVDPLKGWSIGDGTGHFSINIHFQQSDLHGYGHAAYKDPYGIPLWGSFNPTHGEYRRLSGPIADTYSLQQVKYDEDEFAYLTIHVGDTTEESYIALNGEVFIEGSEILTMPVLDPSTGVQWGSEVKHLEKSLFQGAGKDGKLYLSIVSTEVPMQMQVQAKSIEPKVNFVSETAGFTSKTQSIKSDNKVDLPTQQNISGYEFIGYFKDKGMVIPFDSNVDKIYEQTTIYAKYLPTSGDRVTLTVSDRETAYQVSLIKGSKAPDLSALYQKEGFVTSWTKGGTAFNLNTPIDKSTTLYVKYSEAPLDLDHYQFGVKDGKKFQGICDENFWSDEFTNYEIGDTYVDKNGNTIIGSTYGGQQHDDSFNTEKDFTEFMLPGIGQIMDMKKLDVTKPIKIKFSVKNWDAGNGNSGFGRSSIVFSLYDNMTQALQTPNPINLNYDTGAKLRIETSALPKDRYSSQFSHLPDLYGKFLVKSCASDNMFTSDKLTDYGLVKDYEYEYTTIELYISENGNTNTLKINGISQENAFAGLKQSDFVDGTAYLCLSNYGCTNVFRALVSQQSHLSIAEAEHGTFTSDLPQDGIVYFRDKVTFTCTPENGYRLVSASVGNKEFLPDDDTHVTIYKGWDDEEVKVRFAKDCVITFDTQGGNSIKSQTILSGDTASVPKNPKKTGFTFKGWFLDAECTQEFDFATIIEEDLTLYAKWKDKNAPDDEPDTDDPGLDDPGTDDPGTDDPGTDDPNVDDPLKGMEPWGCGVGCGSSLGAGLLALMAIPVAAGALIIKCKKKGE